MEHVHKQLDCSLKTILSVSIPLILSALSSNLLYIIDRMILARYSLNAMNAATMSGSLVAMYAFFGHRYLELLRFMSAKAMGGKIMIIWRYLSGK